MDQITGIKPFNYGYINIAVSGTIINCSKHCMPHKLSVYWYTCVSVCVCVCVSGVECVSSPFTEQYCTINILWHPFLCNAHNIEFPNAVMWHKRAIAIRSYIDWQLSHNYLNYIRECQYQIHKWHNHSYQSNIYEQ